MKKNNKYPDFFEKQINFINTFESIDFNTLKTSEVNNHDKKTKIKKCIDCNNINLIEDNIQGTLICEECGQVVEYLLDCNAEWMHYEDNDVTNVRCSGSINPLLPTSSLGTSIAGAFKSRMKTIHNWHVMPYKERSLNNELKKIHEICQKNNILKCIEDHAKILYKIASECKHADGKNKGKYVITRGKNRISISAGCLYLACNSKGLSYTAKEISDFYEISFSEINRGLKNLRRLIKDENLLKNNTNLPSQFIKRYCNNLKMLNCFTEKSVMIATNIEKINISSDFNPYALAAVCILIVAEIHKLKNINRKKLAAEFNISDVTINKTYKKLEEYKDIILDSNKIDDIVKHNIEEKNNLGDDNDNDDDDIPDEILEKMKEFGCEKKEYKKKIDISKEYHEILKINDLYKKINNNMKKKLMQYL